MGWLAESGAIRAEVARGPLPPEDPAVLVRFERYLLMERRIGAPTTSAYVVRVRRFLRNYCAPEGLAGLGGAEITRALLDEGVGRAPASVKKFGYALRAFLRFCFITGELDHDLTGATLVIREPLPSLLPMGASAAQIDTLLKSCDRSTAIGRRDYAVILLLSRLGLRAGEVAGMRLEDIHWRHGEVLIRRQGRQRRVSSPASRGGRRGGGLPATCPPSGAGSTRGVLHRPRTPTPAEFARGLASRDSRLHPRAVGAVRASPVAPWPC